MLDEAAMAIISAMNWSDEERKPLQSLRSLVGMIVRERWEHCPTNNKWFDDCGPRQCKDKPQ
jgi:hypothetical protein